MGKRLRPLGIDTCVATMPWQPCLSAALQAKLAQEVLRSQHKLTSPKAAQALEHHKQLPLRRLQLKGRTRWSQQLKRWPHPPYTTDDTHTTPTTAQASSTSPSDFWRPAEIATATGMGASAVIARPLPNHIFLQCPKCTHKLSGTKPAFSHTNLDTKIWCNQCRRCRAVRQWQCPCELPWHTCPRHADEPKRLRSQPHAGGHPPRPPSLATTTERATRTLGQGRDSHVQRWLDAPPPKRARPPPLEVELEVTEAAPARPNLRCLGPKLLAKFKLGKEVPTAGLQPPPPAAVQRLMPPPPPPPY